MRKNVLKRIGFPVSRVNVLKRIGFPVSTLNVTRSHVINDLVYSRNLIASRSRVTYSPQDTLSVCTKSIAYLNFNQISSYSST